MNSKKYLQTMILLCVVQISAYAQPLYQSLIGGDNTDRAESIDVFDVEYVGIAGYTAELGSADLLLRKLTIDDDLLWTKVIGGESAEFAQEVKFTEDGGFIITGWTTSFGAGDDDVMLVKTDADGTVEWAKAYGRAGVDRGRSVIQTSDGGYMILGHTSGFGLSANDLYLIKTDALGDTTWVKTYGGINATNENGWSIEETNDGGYISTGNTSEGPGSLNLLMVKFDSQGDTLWTKAIGGENGQTSGVSIVEGDVQNYVAVGWTDAFGAGGRDMFLTLTNPEGELYYSRAFGGPGDDEASGIDLFHYSDYLIAGKTDSFQIDDSAGDNGYVVCVGVGGGIHFQRVTGGEGNQSFQDLAYTERDFVTLFIVAGYSDENESEDMYIYQGGGLSTSDCEETLMFMETVEVEVQCSSAHLSQFFLQEPTQVTEMAFSVDQFLEFDYDYLCIDNRLSTNDFHLNQLLQVYPNPSNGLFQYEIDYSIEKIEVYDILGTRVQEVEHNEQTQTINMQNCVKGIYLVKVTTELGVSTQRLVVE